MARQYKKLVRDKIPEIIRANGSKPMVRTMNDTEYLVELVKKLKEETAEFEADHSVEELADIQEVVMAIRDALGLEASELEEVRRHKAYKNGQFKHKIFLEGVE